MNVSLFHRRRTERLAQLIDEPAGSARRHHGRSTVDDELAALVSLTRRVSDLPMTAEAHPEFRDGLRAVLMATIEREGIGITAKPEEKTDGGSLLATVAASAERRRARMRTRVFGSAVAGLAAAALALSGVSVASGNALPGQALYGVKRSTERAQLALTGSDTSRGQLYLDFAKTRLDEGRAVMNDAPALKGILDEMNAETTDGTRLLTITAIDRGDPAALDVIDAFVVEQRRNAVKLQQSARSAKNTAAANLLEGSIALLGQVAERSAALRPLVKCGSSAVGKEDDLGPTPLLQCSGTQVNQNSKNSTTTPKPSVATTSTGSTKKPLDNEPSGKPSPSGSPSPSASLSGANLVGGLSDIVGGVTGN